MARVIDGLREQGFTTHPSLAAALNPGFRMLLKLRSLVALVLSGSALVTRATRPESLVSNTRRRQRTTQRASAHAAGLRLPKERASSSRPAVKGLVGAVALAE